MVFHSKFSRYFEEIVSQGSMRKAADVLNVAASAVDRQVLNAEQTLGVKLFDRLPSGLRLTPAGSAVAQQIARWSNDEITLLQHIEELRSGKGGEVRIAVADGLAVSFIPALVTRLHEVSPKLRFKITVANAATSANLIRANECDIALTFEPPSFTGLRVEAQVVSRIGTLVRLGHPLTKKSRIRLADCLDYQIIAPDSSTALWSTVENLFAEASLAFNVVFTSNNVALLCDMVKRGLGIAIMRDFDAVGHLTDCNFLPLPGVKTAPQNLSLIVSSTNILRPGLEPVIQEIKAALEAIERNDLPA
ncbi:LysR family transcriptional regulator [Acetobacter sacchari]|nr:LysR family transcriptional regulator [Acetobacter sacchari]